MESLFSFFSGQRQSRRNNNEGASQATASHQNAGPSQETASYQNEGTSPATVRRLGVRRRPNPSDRYPRAFTYQELATATNNFSPESRIGRGGFAHVYRGEIRGVDQPLAVKRPDSRKRRGKRDFLAEVLVLTLFKHENLVKLIGHCAEGGQRLLAYEFLPRGSLDKHLHGVAPENALDWNTRIKIASGVANGLRYLHEGNYPAVIHGDLKTSNILLDEGFNAKLADFGLAKFGPEKNNSNVSVQLVGTPGYVAPEYPTTGMSTTMCDVYSFGVVLLELITGQRPVDSAAVLLVDKVQKRMRKQKDMTKLADPLLNRQFPKSALKSAFKLASWCTLREASDRPNAEQVVTEMMSLVSHP